MRFDYTVYHMGILCCCNISLASESSWDRSVLLLLSSVLQTLKLVSMCRRANGLAHFMPCSITLSPPVWRSRSGASLYTHWTNPLLFSLFGVSGRTSLVEPPTDFMLRSIMTRETSITKKQQISNYMRSVQWKEKLERCTFENLGPWGSEGNHCELSARGRCRIGLGLR